MKNNRRLARRKAHEGVFVFEKRGDGLGGGGGGVGITFIREHGELGTSGTRTRRAHVNGLIPDGVATVRWSIGRLTGTEKVQDNMISFDVAADAARAFPEKMVWRDAGGKIVRVVRERR